VCGRDPQHGSRAEHVDHPVSAQDQSHQASVVAIGRSPKDLRNA
jgi:hypothetical protein